jgi:hypothetical protein
MLFALSLSVPANTAATAPETAVLRIGPGTITHMWIRWRWGIGNLGGCRISYQGFQHWPLNPDEWFPSTHEPLEFDEQLGIAGDTPTLQVKAYNTDDSYDHTLWVGVEVMQPEAAPLTAEQIRQMFYGTSQEVEIEL